MSAVLARRPAGRLVPSGSVAPPVRCLWFPLHTGTSAVTGGTSESGFARQLGVTGTTRGDAATLTVLSGSVAWNPLFGLTFNAPANARLALDPASGDALAFLLALLNLADYQVGQTLMVGCEVETPAGWAAALAGSVTLVSFGEFGAGAGGLAFGVASNERPTIFRRAAGASALGATVVNLVGVDVTGSMADAARNAVVYELQCTAPHTFIARGHLSSAAGTVYTGAWSDPIDLSDPANGGTAAPAPAASAGVRIGGRKNAANNEFRLQLGETLRNVWFAQFPTAPRDSIGPKCCNDMLLLRGVLPRTLRYYSADDVDIAESPDGRYDQAFPPVTLGDMFVAIDGSREITDHPQFTVIAETSTSKGSNKSTNIDALNPEWVSTADYEGTLRIADDPGGLKFGRSELAPASVATPAFVLSSYPTDQSNRNRSEVAWRGPDVTVPYGDVMWIAMRCWYDFDMGLGDGQHVTCSQIYHGGVNAGLNPFYGVSLYQDKISVEFRHCAIEGMTKADQVLVPFPLWGRPDLVRGRWFDMVAKVKLHWDAAQSPFVQFWVDDELVIDYAGPVGYRGPGLKDGNLVPLAPEIRFGNYPGNVTAWSPDTTRDFWLRRAFACRNVGNYTLAQIRAALAG